MSLPLQMPVEQYSRTATMDARDAMALALRRLVEGVRFAECQLDRFGEVYDDWPSFDACEVLPAACILPGSFKYSDWSLSPTLLEETWEPQGKPGWGLEKTAELTCELTLAVRTNLIGERPRIMRAVEDAFQSDNPAINRYGLVVPMPEYYGLLARFALLGGSVIDSEDTAMREKRDAQFTISAITAKVQVGPVWPMALSVTKVIQDPLGRTISSNLIAPSH